MKKLLFSIGLLSLTTTFAQTTICYKESLNYPSQSETIKLDGGLCAGKKSAKDMQKDGWITEDIKLTSGKKGLNYTFIFTKNSKATLTTASALSEEELTQKIVEKLTKQEEIKKTKNCRNNTKRIYYKN